MAHTRHNDKSAILAGRLADYSDWTLIVVCPRCRKRRDVRVRRLVAAHGGHHRVGAVVARLRCSYLNCGAEPSSVTIIDRTHTVLLAGPGAETSSR